MWSIIVIKGHGTRLVAHRMLLPGRTGAMHSGQAKDSFGDDIALGLAGLAGHAQSRRKQEAVLPYRCGFVIQSA